MLNKMARAKDLELEELQLRVNATEGESMHGICCNCIVWHLYYLCKFCPCTLAKLFALVHICVV